MNWQRFMNMEGFRYETEDDLLNEVYRHMFIVAYARTRNKSMALDIVQESWLKILLKLDTLKDSGKLLQWAKVIAANTAINMVKRKESDLLPLIDEGMHIGDLGADLYAVENERKRAVFSALSVLADDERTIMICKFYYLWKDPQIAHAMGMPVGTVKAKIHRAKTKLKRHLQAHHRYRLHDY